MNNNNNTDGKNSVSIREFYSGLDAAKKEIMNPLLRLENKFDALESGRLSELESRVATMQGQAMMIPLMVTLGLNTFFFIVQFVLKMK